MNCKAGDLAMIVRIPPHWDGVLHEKSVAVVKGLIGTVITCVRQGGQNILGDRCWVIAPAIKLPNGFNGTLLDEVEDCALKPIRGHLSLEDIKEMEAA